MVPHPIATTLFAAGGAVLLATLGWMLLQPRGILWYSMAIAITGIEWIIGAVLYRLLLHPLAKYPGPLFASITDWYTVYWIAEGGRHLELHKQHKRYGKYVRYGPNRLSINSAAASRDLHDVNANTFKSDAYGSFKTFFGAEMSLTTLDHKAHAFRRRVNMSAMTPAAVRGLEGQVKPHVDDFIGIVGDDAGFKADGEKGWSSAKNMSHAVGYCIGDIMGSVTFSKTWNAQKDPEYRAILKNLPNGVAGIHLVGHMQSLFLFNMHKVLFRELVAGVGQLMSISRSFALWRMKQTNLPSKDFWSALLASKDPKTGEGFTQEEIISEASLFIIGGTDGMITSAAGTLFYLLHNPRTLARLTREIREAFPLPPDAADKPASEIECPIRFASPELQKITYLPACIDEAMRISPPVPSVLPRMVGPGGMVVDNEFFPAGVNLGIPHYSLHRNEECFPQPLVYAPERWMQNETSPEVPENGLPKAGIAGSGQAHSYSPFGAGRGSCIGKHMAYQEMSIIIARMIWLFDMRLDPVNLTGEGSGKGSEGRERKEEFQLFDRFVSAQEGPMIQFRYREELTHTDTI